MATDKMPRYRRAKLKRTYARNASAADAAQCSTRARTKSALSWLHLKPNSQGGTTNLIWWACQRPVLGSKDSRNALYVYPERWALLLH